MTEKNLVEIIKELHQNELVSKYSGNSFDEFQKELFELMRQLNTNEIAQLAQYALDSWGAKHPKLSETLLMRLFALYPDKLMPFHLKMFELGIDYPCHFYHDCQHELSLVIAEKLPSAEGLKKFRHYEIFVRGGDDYVSQQVKSWEANPPDWWEKTFPIYPLEAGWELRPEGKRRKLYHDTCYQLVHAADESKETKLMQRDDDCVWCNHKLENLLDLDLTDSRLSFLQISGSRLIIPCCTWCHAFKTQFFEIDYSGNAKWSNYNEKTPPQYLEYYDSLPNSLILAKKPRGQFESLIMEYGQSQIGGFPAWVNDAAYPVCPSCKKHMQFIGQIQWIDIEAAEGLSYAYLCTDCKLAAVNYDQT